MADTLRVTRLDRVADVEQQAFGRHEARSQFARVQRDMHRRVKLVSVVDHPHVGVIIAHGVKPVFRLDEVHGDDTGVGGGEGEAGHDLGEDFGLRHFPEHLVDVIDLNAAGRGVGCGGAAEEKLIAPTASMRSRRARRVATAWSRPASMSFARATSKPPSRGAFGASFEAALPDRAINSRYDSF